MINKLNEYLLKWGKMLTEIKAPVYVMPVVFWEQELCKIWVRDRLRRALNAKLNSVFYILLVAMECF